MADSSFDVVSKIDRMELDNAINQAIREIDTRFDFKNTGAKIEMVGEKINIEADTEERAKATLDVVKDKLIKRGVSLKHIDPSEPQLSGKIYKISCPLKEGISTENAKKIAKFLRDEGPKSVKSQIPVSYTTLTLPTNRKFEDHVVRRRGKKTTTYIKLVAERKSDTCT